MNDTIVSLTAVLALIVSVASFVHTIRNSRLQRDLTLRETELVRIQLEKERASVRDEVQAVVSARMYKAGRSDWRIRVFNAGPSAAYDVSIRSVVQQESFLVDSDVASKFPMSKMEKGQSAELHAAVYMGSNVKEDVELSWQDAKGKRTANVVSLTL